MTRARGTFANSFFESPYSLKGWWLLAALVWLVPVVVAKEIQEPAKWSVKQAGFFKNRTLKKQLDLIFEKDRDRFDASDIEDAALILISYLEGEGYLAAKAIATITRIPIFISFAMLFMVHFFN